MEILSHAETAVTDLGLSEGGREKPATIFLIHATPRNLPLLKCLNGTAGWRLKTFPSVQAYLGERRDAAAGCVILDISELGLDRGDIQCFLRDDGGLPVVLINGQMDVRIAVCAIKAGAFDFLPGPVDEDAFRQAVETAIALHRNMFDQEERVQTLRVYRSLLSKREREVMTLAVAGLMNKQIGRRLGITEPTVKAHRGQVMRKMRARSFADLVNMARDLGGACER